DALPISQVGIVDIGESDYRRSAPQLVSHYLRVDRIAEVAGEDDEVGLEAFDLAAQVVEWRHDGGLGVVRLEQRVEPDRGLDVGECDEDLHSDTAEWVGTERRSFISRAAER